MLLRILGFGLFHNCLHICRNRKKLKKQILAIVGQRHIPNKYFKTKRKSGTTLEETHSKYIKYWKIHDFEMFQPFNPRKNRLRRLLMEKTTQS